MLISRRQFSTGIMGALAGLGITKSLFGAQSSVQLSTPSSEGFGGLTRAQELIIEENKKRWVEIGLNCDSCDVEASKKAIRQAYADAEQPCPDIWFLYESPASCAVGQAITDKLIFGGKPPRTKKNYRAQTVKIYPRALESCLQQLKDQYNFTPTKRQLRSVELNKLNLDFYLDHQIYGSHDAPWLSWYDTWHRLGKEEEVKPLRGLIDLAHHCGWWAAYDEAIFLQHRHLRIHMNDQNQLHNPSGPAVLYRDGYAMYYVNGEKAGE